MPSDSTGAPTPHTGTSSTRRLTICSTRLHSADEILALAREMNLRIDCTWMANGEDEELQESYRRLFSPSHYAHGSPSTIGADILRQNRELPK